MKMVNQSFFSSIQESKQKNVGLQTRTDRHVRSMNFPNRGLCSCSTFCLQCDVVVVNAFGIGLCKAFSVYATACLFARDVPYHIDTLARFRICVHKHNREATHSWHFEGGNGNTVVKGVEYLLESEARHGICEHRV